MTRRMAFVLEQTLGHVAHSRNIEAALAAHGWIDPTVIKIDYGVTSGPLRWLPGGGNWSLRASLTARQGLRRRLAQGPLDAIFIHTQVASLLSAGTMARVPTVVSLDATPRDFDEVGAPYRHRRQGRLAEAVKLAVNRRSLRGAAALVTWSHQVAGTLADHYGVDPARITVIRPGVNLGSFKEMAPRAPSDRFRILFVGGDFRRKGGPDLLEAMRLLPATAELDIVTGSHVAVPPGITCRVHVGLTPGEPRLVDLYRRADAFALPTLGDCLPQVLAEAAACALPLVASNSGAIGEIVRPGTNGLIVPAGSPRELAAALRLLHDNVRLRLALGQASLALAREEHDAERNNARIFELMAGLRPAGDSRGRAAVVVAR